MRQKQLSLLPKSPLIHGGGTRAGKRKTARPLSVKCPLHVTLRSSIAKGSMSMLHPKRERYVNEQVRKTAQKHSIRLRRYVNVGNHLHLIVQIPSKSAWKAFIRELAGVLAMLMTGARKGSAQKFWDGTAFTRIVTWGRDYENLKRYFIKNVFEAAGVSIRKAREQGLELIHQGWGHHPKL